MSKAAVFGFSKGTSHPSDHDGLTIWWHESVDSLRSLDPSSVEAIVCPFLHSVYAWGTHGQIDTSELDQLVRALGRVAESGVACCLLVGTEPGVLKQDVPTCLGERLLTVEGVRMRAMPIVGLRAQPECLAMGAEAFEDYLRASNVLAHVVFELPEDLVPVPYLILAQGTGAQRDVWGFAIRKGEGLIYVLPGQPTVENRTDFMPVLIRALLRFRSVSRPRRAFITESFQFTRERQVRANRDTLAKKTSELDQELGEYEARKDILFLRDDELADRIADWLPQHLHLPTKRMEEYREDLWITDEQGGERAICEVKALNDNVKRKHISQLVLHREERERPDEYPSILVANTFADAATVREKDRQRVATLEVRKAVKLHVLVVRTLDLLRLLDQVETGSLTQAQVEQLLLTSTGWLRVTAKGYGIVKD